MPPKKTTGAETTKAAPKTTAKKAATKASLKPAVKVAAKKPPVEPAKKAATPKAPTFKVGSRVTFRFGPNERIGKITEINGQRATVTVKGESKAFKPFLSTLRKPL